MKTLRSWSLILMGLAFSQTSAIQAAEEDAGEEIRAPFGCRSESYCFYDAADYSGRSVVLSACNGTRQPLNAYGLAKQVSSWVNTSDARIIVEDAYGNFLWSEPPHSQSPQVERGKDNRAWYFRCLAPE